MLDGDDIFSVPRGTVCGEYTAEKDGWFLSDKYLKDVAEAKVR